MKQRRKRTHFHPDKLMTAGEKAPAGRYRQVETDRMIVLDHEDFLPASLDGRVACYVPVEETWEEVKRSRPPSHHRQPSQV